MSMLRAVILSMGIVLLSGNVLADKSTKVPVSIEAQPLTTALNQWAEQTGMMVMVSAEGEAGMRVAPGVHGEYTPEKALTLLLASSGLSYEFVSERTVAVRVAKAEEKSQKAGDKGKESERPLGLPPAKSESDPPPTTPSSSSDSSSEEASATQGVPEILVKGSRVLNMDIRRDRDGAQPYVVFERDKIQQSGARDINEFLKQRLPMNTVSSSTQQVGAQVSGGNSSINLRGLGTNQTLILVDGHRVSGLRSSTNASQPDINGIPLSAIERIEVLPATASGIYGGGATGGAINIILRKDYNGVEAKVAYENTFEGYSPTRQVDFSAGFNLEHGKTNILLSGRWLDDGGLQSADRDFLARGRERILANNPNTYYGSSTPPLGSTANIRSQDGSNLVLKPAYGGFALNSPRTFVPVGYAGIASDAAQALRNNAGNYNFAMPDSAQSVGSAGTGGGWNLLNEATRESVTATVRREFARGVQAFVEASGSNSRSKSHINFLGSYRLQPSAPNNPFLQAINVAVPIDLDDDGLESWAKDRRVVGGVIVRLPRDWMLSADYTRQEMTFSLPRGTVDFISAGNTAITSGAIDVLRAPESYQSSLVSYVTRSSVRPEIPMTLGDAALRFSGPLFRVSTGAVQLSGLIETRRWVGDKYEVLNFGNNTMDFNPSLTQSVDSVYAEVRWPLLQSLDMQVALRRDEYHSKTSGPTVTLPLDSVRPADAPSSNSPSSNDYTLAFLYRPLRDVALRASYGTGFLPPEPDQILPVVSTTSTSTIIDPRRGTTSYAPSNVSGAGNPSLTPEQSRSLSLGMIVTPAAVAGLRVSLDYIRVKKTDNITTLTSQQFVDNESLFPERIVRNTDPSTFGPYSVGPITRIDATSVNISSALVEAFDLQLDYQWDTARWGSFEAFAVATRQTKYETQLLPTSPVVNRVGIASSSPLKFKANAGLTWNKSGWSVGWMTRYFDAYLIADPTSSSGVVAIANQGGNGEVKEQLYHDLFATYRFEDRRLLEGTEVSLGLKNVFDKTPPFDASTASAAYYSYFGDPRLRSYSLTLKRSF